MQAPDSFHNGFKCPGADQFKIPLPVWFICFRAYFVTEAKVAVDGRIELWRFVHPERRESPVFVSAEGRRILAVFRRSLKGKSRGEIPGLAGFFLGHGTGLKGGTGGGNRLGFH